MTTLYMLDVPENTGVAKVAAEDPAVGRRPAGRPAGVRERAELHE